MKSAIDHSPETIEILMKFLEKNRKSNFIEYDLNNEESIDELDFKGLIKKKDIIVPLIKAYQRLMRIVPEENEETALMLLKEGIHSALQIAAMTRKDFMTRFANLFNDNGKMAEAIYNNALDKRSVILIQYMDLLQNNEPHISSAKFD